MKPSALAAMIERRGRFVTLERPLSIDPPALQTAGVVALILTAAWQGDVDLAAQRQWEVVIAADELERWGFGPLQAGDWVKASGFACRIIEPNARYVGADIIGYWAKGVG